MSAPTRAARPRATAPMDSESAASVSYAIIKGENGRVRALGDDSIKGICSRPVVILINIKCSNWKHINFVFVLNAEL